MGALNVSPESFHAGSVHTLGEDLLVAALAMVEAGAALLVERRYGGWLEVHRLDGVRGWVLAAEVSRP